MMTIVYTDAFGNEQTLKGAVASGDASTSYADQQLRLECFKAVKDMNAEHAMENAEKLYRFVKHGIREAE